MRKSLHIAVTSLVAGAAITALVAAAIPVWLLLRVPGAVTSPGTEHP